LDRPSGALVTLVVPELIREQGLLAYLLRRRSLIRLKASLLREGDVAITDVPVVIPRGDPVGAGRALIPSRTATLVFVSSVSQTSARAVALARSMDAPITRAITFEVDPGVTAEIEDAWFESGFELPLDIVEAPFRDLSVPMLEEVRRLTERGDTVVNVVVPEVVVSRWWQLPLHNQSALFIKRLFLREPNVVLTSVPLVLGSQRSRSSSTADSSAP
jgi:hypothetical protein